MDFCQQTVNYFLLAVIGVLYSCICPKLVVLPDNIDDETTICEPERHHKLIVDSTFIANHQSKGSAQRKAYYHVKSPTTYAFKLQIACGFHHRVVHVSRCYPSSVHDIKILRESGLLEHSQEDVHIIADKGYISEQNVITPKNTS